MSFSVTFTGFETKEQAKAFADWYSGSGEQESCIWLEEHTDISFAEAGRIQERGDVIEVPLTLHKK